MNDEMNVEAYPRTAEAEIVTMFRALGDPVRLGIFEFLQRCTKPVALDEEGGVHRVDGPTVGEVCCHITGVDKITSTISHHLKELRLAGLICVERRGRNMICSVHRDNVARLSGYLGAFGSLSSSESSTVLLPVKETDNVCCNP